MRQKDLYKFACKTRKTLHHHRFHNHNRDSSDSPTIKNTAHIEILRPMKDGNNGTEVSLLAIRVRVEEYMGCDVSHVDIAVEGLCLPKA
jgi:hypothetical protein